MLLREWQETEAMLRSGNKVLSLKANCSKGKKTDEQPNGTIDLTQLILDNQNDTNQIT